MYVLLRCTPKTFKPTDVHLYTELVLRRLLHQGQPPCFHRAARPLLAVHVKTRDSVTYDDAYSCCCFLHCCCTAELAAGVLLCLGSRVTV